MNLKVVIGTDDYLVETTVRKALGDGVGLEVIDSRNSTNADLQLADIRAADSSFSTPPFLDPRKITWWKNVHFLPSGGKKAAAEDVKEALERFADKLVSLPLPENQLFILSGPALLKTSVFAKKLAKSAELIVFTASKPWEASQQAVARVVDLAAELGLSFEAGVAEVFVARVGTDTRSLVSELEKLRSYLGEGITTITREAVADISSPGVGIEPEVWDITDALGARNLDEALAAVARFEGEAGFSVLVTTVVEKFFRQLYDLKKAEADGTLEQTTQGLNPYVLRKQRGFLQKWALSELRAARARFLALRERAVSSSSSVDPLVTTTLVRVVMRRGGRR